MSRKMAEIIKISELGYAAGFTASSMGGPQVMISGEPGNDTGKDDKRNPIANTTGCNLIAKPHEEARAGSQDDGNHENHGPAIHQCVVDLEGITHGKSLDETEDNRAPACYFLDFITAILIVLGPLLKGRHHRG